MSPRPRFSIPLAVIATALAISPAAAGALGGTAPGYVPRVPVSALAMPVSWFDPSRLQVSTSVSVGSGFGGGTNALQVTRLSYRFAAPIWMNVSVGNAWGSSNPNGRGSFFLEGLDLAYRPLPSLLVRVQYHDIRSPLQYSNGAGYGLWSP